MNDFDREKLWLLDDVWVGIWLGVNDFEGEMLLLLLLDNVLVTDMALENEGDIVEEYDINVDDVNEYVSESNR